jgi:hypothetical protein
VEEYEAETFVTDPDDGPIYLAIGFRTLCPVNGWQMLTNSGSSLALSTIRHGLTLREI